MDYKKFEELREKLQEVNSYNGGYENIIKYDRDVFWDLLDGVESERIANMIYFGDYNPHDEYIGFNGYGNIESMDAMEYYDELLSYEEEIEEEYKEIFE